ncbi:MAG: hypothetical protein JWO18_2385 [Microbacteriaceae bacterium]|jgi:hypothetical protein|nr:hypothetical protein [Microbacteriaceae bacterium]
MRRRMTRPAETLEVMQLSSHEWRICDPRLPSDDARRVLGFIELKNGTYEALQLRREFEWFCFESLDDAISHFIEMSTVDVGADEGVSR